MCNQEIKFNAFLDHAMKIDGDYIAMGHYARKSKDNELLKGIDENKDQSYFLARIEKEALKKAIFPVGEYKKDEIRKIANELGLRNANKKDSTGICFIGERDFDKFLDKYLFTKPGDIIDVDSGKVIGKHKGIIHYTNGQRKGLGIGGIGNLEPWFVCGKNINKNIIYAAQGVNHPANYSIGLIGEDIHFIGDKPSDFNGVKAKFRYRQKDVDVDVKIKNDEMILEFDDFKGITPGQVAVLYKGDVLIGSSIIKKPIPKFEKYSYLNDCVD